VEEQKEEEKKTKDKTIAHILYLLKIRLLKITSQDLASFK
jgi:hypothetical protein